MESPCGFPGSNPESAHLMSIRFNHFADTAARGFSETSARQHARKGVMSDRVDARRYGVSADRPECVAGRADLFLIQEEVATGLSEP